VNANLEGEMDDLKQTFKRAVGKAKAEATSNGRGTEHVNVAGRANVVVASTLGQRDAVKGATVRQRVRIRQQGADNLEEYEETTSTS